MTENQRIPPAKKKQKKKKATKLLIHDRKPDSGNVTSHCARKMLGPELVLSDEGWGLS